MSFEIPDLFLRYYIDGNSFRSPAPKTMDAAIQEIKNQTKVSYTNSRKVLILSGNLKLEKNKATGEIKFYKKAAAFGTRNSYFKSYDFNPDRKPRHSGFSLSPHNYWKLWVIFKHMDRVFVSHQNTVKMVTAVNLNKFRAIKLIDKEGKSSSVHLKNIECLVPISSFDEVKIEEDTWIKKPGVVDINDVFGNRIDVGQHILYHNSGTFFYFGKIIGIQENKNLGTKIKISIAKAGSKKRRRKFHTFSIDRGIFVAFDEDEAFKRLLMV